MEYHQGWRKRCETKCSPQLISLETESVKAFWQVLQGNLSTEGVTAEKHSLHRRRKIGKIERAILPILFLLRMSARRSSISLFFPLEGPGGAPKRGLHRRCSGSPCSRNPVLGIC